MAAFVRYAQGYNANPVLAAPPTPGNILVCFGYHRSAAIGAPTGFTLLDARSAGPSPFLNISYRVVQSGDGATIVVPGSFARYVVMEFSGLDVPGVVSTGSLGDTTLTAINPAGVGWAIGGYFVHTDQGDRYVQVKAPSTAVYEYWHDEAGFGPWGSMGYDATGTLSIQATSGAISYHTQVYYVYNFPLKAVGKSQVVIV